MRRVCARCGREFTPKDLARDDSRTLEAERKAAGLQGVRFLSYQCPCGASDLFVDVLPRDDEFAEDFERRKAEMEATARRLNASHPEALVQVVPVNPP
jgi:hypothetical protein